MCVCMCVCLWESVSLCKYIFNFKYISGFPNWCIVMKGYTLGRGTQVYRYAFVVTTSVYIKWISEFKIFYISFLGNIIRKIYFTIDCLKEYVIWHLTYSTGDWLGGYLPSSCPSHPSSTRVNSAYSTSVRPFIQLSECWSIFIFHYSLKKYNNLFGNFAGIFGEYYPGGPNA